MSSKRPKLLFVVTEDWYFWSHRLPIAKAALEAGYDVAVATRVNEHGKRITEAGFRLIPLQMNRGSYSFLHEVRAISELRDIYRREKPDIIHQVALKPILYGSIAAMGLGNVPIINAFAGLGYLVSSSSIKAKVLRSGIWTALRFLLKRGNSFVLLQNREDQELLIREIGVPTEKTTVIRGSGVDMDQFKPTTEASPERAPTVLLSSRMLWIKGINDFVDAAKILRDKGLTARFVLVGDTDLGSPGAIPRAQLVEWQRSGMVEWWGHQPSMHETLREAAIVSLPSHGGEGVPKALIEAAACGRAIVATDVPGCRDIVRHRINGLLVPPKNPMALADALQELLADSSTRSEMGRRGREIASNEFSEESVIQQTLALYSKVLTCCSPTLNSDAPPQQDALIGRERN
jgi:glycosyltransferase involved in cell wall biosynthesis